MIIDCILLKRASVCTCQCIHASEFVNLCLCRPVDGHSICESMCACMRISSHMAYCTYIRTKHCAIAAMVLLMAPQAFNFDLKFMFSHFHSVYMAVFHLHHHYHLQLPASLKYENPLYSTEATYKVFS